MRTSALALLGLSFSCGAGAGAPGAEVFAPLPEETQPTISPDGHWLAWLLRKEPPGAVTLVDVGARKTLRTVALSQGSTLRWLDWQNNDTLLMSMQVAGGTAPGLFAQNVDSGVTRSIVGPLGYLVSARTSKPYTVLIGTAPLHNLPAGRSSALMQLMEVDTRTGGAKVVKYGGERTLQWFVDRDGRPVAREDWEWRQNQYRVYALEGESHREILRRDDSDPPKLAGALPDGSALVLLAINGRPHQAAWALPLDGSPLQLLAEAPDTDVTDVFIDRYSGAVIGVYASGLDTAVRWSDPAAQQRYDTLARAFPGRVAEPYSWTEDGTRVLARVSSASAPPVYYLTDFKTLRSDIAAEAYPGLAGVALGEVKQITYKSRDGTDIPAYLATPPGMKPPYSLVVLPHGGPNDRNFLRFDPLLQFLATRGYAVLQPQFRGSTGFGDAYRDAGDRQWGGLMQDDITDGVRAMVSQQIADPRRVGIVGITPYGGYSALAGAAFTPDLYQCVVSINGISDLPAYVASLLPSTSSYTLSSSVEAGVKKRIGNPRDAQLQARSPINAIGSIRAPILIMYSGNKGLLPMQSANLAHALAVAGKDVKLDTLPGDAWSNNQARIGLFRELEHFLAQHLRPE